jgi:hypothetical protein
VASDSAAKKEQELNQSIAVFSPLSARAPREITAMKHCPPAEVALFIHPAYA